MKFQAVKHMFKPISSAELEALDNASPYSQGEQSVGLDDVGLVGLTRAIKAKRFIKELKKPDDPSFRFLI